MLHEAKKPNNQSEDESKEDTSESDYEIDLEFNENDDGKDTVLLPKKQKLTEKNHKSTRS